MNWLTNIIVLQLILGQALSYLTCLKSQKCSCQKNFEIDEIEVTCNSSTVRANMKRSLVEIQCNFDQIQWEQFFNQINVKQLNYKNCILSDSGIHHNMAILGINEVKDIYLINMKLISSLERSYLIHLESLNLLDISSTNLILTNESFEGTPHLKQLFLRDNNIEELPNGVFKRLRNLEILDLGGNKLSKIDSDIFDGVPLTNLFLYSNHLKTLNLNIPSLKHLDVSNNRLTSITVENLNKLVQLSLNKNNIITVTGKLFKNTSLEFIKYNYGNFTVPDEFLSSLYNLNEVQLTYLKLENVPENMIWNSSNITVLSLASNRLKELPVNFFRDSNKMKVLNLSKNQIEKIDHQLLKPLTQLEELNLSNNLISQINNNGLSCLGNLIYLYLENNQIMNIERRALNMNNLKYLNLAYNKISNLSPNNLFSFEYLGKVEVIDLSHNNIVNFAFGWHNLLKLQKVNLSKNNFTVLSIEEIHNLNTRLKIDLSLNPFKVIDLSLLEFLVRESDISLNTNTTPILHVILSGNRLICGCQNFDFARYLQNQMPKITYKYIQIEQNLSCDDGTEFANVKLDSLTCDWKFYDDVDKTDCSECECTFRPYDRSAIMNCSSRNLTFAPKTIISSRHINYIELNLQNNSIMELPDYKHLNIQKLNVGYNKLTKINITHLPKHIMELNLEHNNLMKISELILNDTLTNLNRLSMSGNPWACNCEANDTFKFIHKYSSKISDLANITCASSVPLYTLQTMKEICQDSYELKNVNLMVACISLAVCGVLLGLLLSFYYRYTTEIKIWLYSHNVTWPISEKSLDQDKKYDAFLSFSHKDLELVAKHLVPELEGGNTPFKLCLHYRDWVVGDFIPSQISRSVDESRRTIIVLSKNFLDSIWGLTEFRTAYTNVLKEKRNRIIVILYGDISTEELDLELKTYLSMNTYIKWGDYWFWEKLRYALPHGLETRKKIRTKTIVPDKLNPLSLS
ncbi:Hypothetical protein CINCED_3A013100 [Cinara cedri]|nr:Hypothetical protein CINCED_3A013100 [Cinara cedri]